MTDQTSDALRISAWDDLRHYVRKPWLFHRHANVNQFFQTLWMVYFHGTQAFASFDEFHDEAKTKVVAIHKQLAGKSK